MKSLMLFLQCVLNDLGTRCHTSTTNDLKTIVSRVEHEGLSFLTITLSNFGADLQKGLDQSYVDPSFFAGFQRRGGLPLFLGGFLDLVFDRGTGRLLDSPSVEAIFCLRQFLLMWSKISVPCSESRVRGAIDRYIECEKEVKQYDTTLSPDSRESWLRIGSLLWTNIFVDCDRRVYNLDILPKHGPGATADKLVGNGKYNQLEWPQRLDEVFPSGELLLPNWSYYKELDQFFFLEPGAERPVRVITVPKTLKTPRIIAIEPTATQYVQQGLLEMITEAIEGDSIASWLINYSSQIPNQELARQGSLSGDLATLDLSEASDRVSNQLVRGLLRNHPHLLAGVDASRSRKADVPGHGVIRLAKFASMGSALCFPMESIVFATTVFYGIEQALNRPITLKDIKSLKGQVRIYGDDIIVPTRFVSSVYSALETFGFRVNAGKSFWTGKFRESCGRDYYDGRDVSITKVRSMFPSKRKHVQEIVSTVALRNQLFHAGFQEAIVFLDNMIENLIPFPIVEDTSSIIGKHSYGPYKVERMCDKLHKPLVKGVVVSTRLPISQLEGYGALMKWFLKRGELPFADRNHLERAGRPLSVDIKTRWSSPF